MRNRNYRSAAQGCERWYREIAGRTFMFVYVRRGWWGVGESGTLYVKRSFRPGGDYFTVKTFRNVGNVRSGWAAWATS